MYTIVLSYKDATWICTHSSSTEKSHPPTKCPPTFRVAESPLHVALMLISLLYIHISLSSPNFYCLLYCLLKMRNPKTTRHTAYITSVVCSRFFFIKLFVKHVRLCVDWSPTCFPPQEKKKKSCQQNLSDTTSRHLIIATYVNSTELNEFIAYTVNLLSSG